MSSIISVSNLTKSFSTPVQQAGLMGAIKSFIKPIKQTKTVVDKISFSIDPGEMVGFLGPNGAGKTTTLKMLSGLLYPDSGEVKVLGHTPFDRNHQMLKQITLVMGQKTQLWWDLPPMDTFKLHQAIYEIPDDKFNKDMSFFTDVLDVSEILTTPVRKLSLGQRMKCELISALIHQPKVLFLDEPTIGLDLLMQESLRDFIVEYNRKFKATVILTSHYMKDVEAICQRVILIDHGKIGFDGSMKTVKEKYGNNGDEIEVIMKKAFKDAARTISN